MTLSTPDRRIRTLYLWSVILAGTIAIADSFEQLSTSRIGYQWLVLAALTVIGSSATIRIRSVNSTISVSETFVFASVLLFGQAAGTLTVALDALVMSIWFGRQGGVERLLFNTSAAALSLWTGALVFVQVLGERPLALEPAAPLASTVLATLVLTLVYFLLNTWLVSFAVAFEKGVPPYRIWRGNFAWLSVNYLAGAALAVLFVGYSNRLDVWYLAVLVVVIAAFYFTFRGAVGQTEDAIRHLEDLNRLHLSTIEALAAAVDAKDQTTHGHIRRVQELAVRLARSVGVTDETEVKAIEAAALLHDLGKLAVPDYILNKPGKLSEGELETMKLHATAGADILSSIEFPYPVVPVVRHHHENWDGSGYPDGLRGEAIPIGARILAVVDCFDALTSDRPYRRRLSTVAALEIIRERRGAMYDPGIVGAFLEMNSEAGEADVQARPRSNATLEKIRQSTRQWPATSEPPSGSVVSGLTADAVRRVYSLGRQLSPSLAHRDAAAVVTEGVRKLILAELCVFYDYDADKQALTASAASGDEARLVIGLRMPIGQRLSGWVAANRQSVMNGDPALDLHDTPAARLSLKSCLSLPLLSSDQLLAVLTLYATAERAFEAPQLALLELVGREVAESLAVLPISSPDDGTVHRPSLNP